MRTQVLHSYSSSSLASFSSNVLNQSPHGITCPGDTPEVGSSDSGDGCVHQLKHRAKSLCRRRQFEKLFPVLKWSQDYNAHKLMCDLIAGLTVGLTILPQGLAYATVAGLPPIYGLYSGFIGPLVYILFGSTKVITIGPNAIQCILTYKFTHGKPPEYAVLFCFICGVVSLTMAFLRLGFIANFISGPVISGFTSAVSLTIIATQIKPFLGIHFDEEGFLPTLKGVWEHISEVKQWDAILSVISCILLLFLQKLPQIFSCWTQNSPRMAKALWIMSTSKNALIITGCTVLAACWSSDNHPFSLVGDIVSGLPEFKPPPFSIYNPATNATQYFSDIVKEEASSMIIMPILGILGHMTIAKAFADATRIDATQEVLAIGVTNMIASFFSSMPVAGSFSRTTVNAFSGAQSPLGGLVTGAMVILALQFLTPYFYFIPKASLAAVVSVSVVFMVDFKILRPMWRSKKMDLLPWGMTFFVTLLVGLEYGIITGLAVSAIYLLYYAARPRVRVMRGVTNEDREFLLVEMDRSLTYPSVDHVTDVVMKAVTKWTNNSYPIVVDCHHIQFVDFTAAEALRDLVRQLQKEDYKIIFWKVKPSVLRIVNSVMESGNTPFIYCKSEDEMECLVNTHNFLSVTTDK